MPRARSRPRTQTKTQQRQSTRRTQRRRIRRKYVQGPVYGKRLMIVGADIAEKLIDKGIESTLSLFFNVDRKNLPEEILRDIKDAISVELEDLNERIVETVLENKESYKKVVDSVLESTYEDFVSDLVKRLLSNYGTYIEKNIDSILKEMENMRVVLAERASEKPIWISDIGALGSMIDIDISIDSNTIVRDLLNRLIHVLKNHPDEKVRQNAEKIALWLITKVNPRSVADNLIRVLTRVGEPRILEATTKYVSSLILPQIVATTVKKVIDSASLAIIEKVEDNLREKVEKIEEVVRRMFRQRPRPTIIRRVLRICSAIIRGSPKYGTRNIIDEIARKLSPDLMPIASRIGLDPSELVKLALTDIEVEKELANTIANKLINELENISSSVPRKLRRVEELTRYIASSLEEAYDRIVEDVARQLRNDIVRKAIEKGAFVSALKSVLGLSRVAPMSDVLERIESLSPSELESIVRRAKELASKLAKEFESFLATKYVQKERAKTLRSTPLEEIVAKLSKISPRLVDLFEKAIRKKPSELTPAERRVLVLAKLLVNPQSIGVDTAFESHHAVKNIMTWVTSLGVRGDIPGVDTPDVKPFLREVKKLLKKQKYREIEKLVLGELVPA